MCARVYTLTATSSKSFKLDNAHVPRLFPVRAAFAIGLAALRAGQDVHDAVTAAGFSLSLADATVNKLSTMSNRLTSSAPSSAPVPRNIKRYVKNCMDQVSELQTITTISLNPTPGTGGALTSVGFETIVQGSADNNRKGDVIHVLSFHLKGVVISATTNSSLRVIVFRDLQSNGSTPTVAQVLNSANYLSMYNALNVTSIGGTRFKILSDRLFCQTVQVAAAAVYHAYDVQFDGKFMITYITNGGTAASVGTNNIWILTIADNATSQFNCSMQGRYLDG